jgi:homoserine kinase
MADASAPASSANLGPGFDVLALALELRCRVRAVPASGWTVEHVGGEQPEGPGDAVLAAAQRAVGMNHPLHLTVDNQIPIGKGLGSSAAAATAGAVAAWRARGQEPADQQIFELVAAMEDHPDNAAASVFGGLVLCAHDGRVHRLPLHTSLVPLVAVPNTTLSTTEARAALPERLERSMVVRSLSRLAALVAGLISGDEHLLAAASGDEMHETPRDALRPEVGKALAAARAAGAAHAAWSGSGPAVVALVDPANVVRVAQALEAAIAGGRVLELKVAATGYE